MTTALYDRERAQRGYEQYLRDMRTDLAGSLGVIGVAAFGIGISPEPAAPRGAERNLPEATPETTAAFSRDITRLVMPRMIMRPQGTIEQYALAA